MSVFLGLLAPIAIGFAIPSESSCEDEVFDEQPRLACLGIGLPLLGAAIGAAGGAVSNVGLKAPSPARGDGDVPGGPAAA